MGKVQEEDEQEEEAGIGEGYGLEDLAYKGPRVLDPHMDGSIAQPA